MAQIEDGTGEDSVALEQGLDLVARYPQLTEYVGVGAQRAGATALLKHEQQTRGIHARPIRSH